MYSVQCTVYSVQCSVALYGAKELYGGCLYLEHCNLNRGDYENEEGRNERSGGGGGGVEEEEEY